MRVDAELLGRAEAKAALLGMDRAQYVRSLIEEDVAGGCDEGRREFASEDLAGMYEGLGVGAGNQVVREQLGRRATGSGW